MIPYKKSKGVLAFKRVMCYIGIPDQFKDKLETIEKANVKKMSNVKYITVGEVCKGL